MVDTKKLRSISEHFCNGFDKIIGDLMSGAANEIEALRIAAAERNGLHERVRLMNERIIELEKERDMFKADGKNLREELKSVYEDLGIMQRPVAQDACEVPPEVDHEAVMDRAASAVWTPVDECCDPARRWLKDYMYGTVGTAPLIQYIPYVNPIVESLQNRLSSLEDELKTSRENEGYHKRLCMDLAAKLRDTEAKLRCAFPVPTMGREVTLKLVLCGDEGEDA